MLPLHLNYLLEKLYMTVLSLAGGDAPILRRLVNVYTGPLHNLVGSDWSEIDTEASKELRAALATLAAAYDSEPAKHWGSFPVMNEEEAKKVAEELVGAYGCFCRLRERQEILDSLKDHGIEYDEKCLWHNEPPLPL